jgi:hypothetical protein
MARTSDGYNGWTNYETWRVNLEIFDGYDPSDDFAHSRAEDVQELAADLADMLRDLAENLVSETSREGIALDYALAFLSAVNYREIAERFVEDYADRIPEHIRNPESVEA